MISVHSCLLHFRYRFHGSNFIPKLSLVWLSFRTFQCWHSQRGTPNSKITVSSDITESEAGTPGTLFILMALIRVVIGPVDYHGDLTADETLCDLVLSGGFYVWGTVRPPCTMWVRCCVMLQLSDVCTCRNEEQVNLRTPLCQSNR